MFRFIISVARSHFTNPSSSSWLLQNAKSSASSDTSSIDSLESDATEDEPGEEDTLSAGKDRIPIPWERQINPQDFIALAQRALNHLQPDLVAAFLDVFEAFVISWVFQHTPSNFASGGETPPPSFSPPRIESSSRHTASKSSGQKRAQDEDDEESPDRSGDNNPPKRQKVYDGMDAGCRQKWACPFYQREPERYCVETEFGDFRKCSKSPGFNQVHRVKCVHATLP